MVEPTACLYPEPLTRTDKWFYLETSVKRALMSRDPHRPPARPPAPTPSSPTAKRERIGRPLLVRRGSRVLKERCTEAIARVPPGARTGALVRALRVQFHPPAPPQRRQTAFLCPPSGSPGPPLPVRAVRSSRRDAVDADIGFYAQNGLVLALGRHLDSTVMDGSRGGACACVRDSFILFGEASFVLACVRPCVCDETVRN